MDNDTHVSPFDYSNPYGAWKEAVKQGMTTKSFKEYTDYLIDDKKARHDQLAKFAEENSNFEEDHFKKYITEHIS